MIVTVTGVAMGRPAFQAPGSALTLRPLDQNIAELHDPEFAAQRADLVYVSDQEPGIRRKRAGKGFYYLHPDDRKVDDPETLARIRALAIPPAWEDVWISTEPAGHIQATGRDAKGRKQYRYHSGWTACRDEAKFSSLADFARSLPVLRDRVERDMRQRSLSRERVVASLVWLLDNALIRIGNDIYAKENKSYGLTTLKERHVEVEGSRLRFSFRGKSGQEWNLQLADRRIARVIRSMQELPGQRLFQYLGEDKSRHDVHSHDVNIYIRETIGERYSSKHFRTWGATTIACDQLRQMELPDTKKERARLQNQVIDRVAKTLNNTRAVCRRCYIHPLVLSEWEDGRLQPVMAEYKRRYRKPLKGMDLDESLVLRWLERKTGN